MTHYIRTLNPTTLAFWVFCWALWGATGHGGGLEMLIFQGLPGKDRAGSPKKGETHYQTATQIPERPPAPGDPASRPRPACGPAGLRRDPGGSRRPRRVCPEACNPQRWGKEAGHSPPRPRRPASWAAGGREELGKACRERCAWPACDEFLRLVLNSTSLMVLKKQ